MMIEEDRLGKLSYLEQKGYPTHGSMVSEIGVKLLKVVTVWLNNKMN
jgi:hypothetical protein